MRRAILWGLIVLVVPALAGRTAWGREQAGSDAVVVDGESPVYEGNVAQAKERALQEAFSAAISQVVGAYISAESYSQNFVSIDRSVVSKTQGYVTSYEILESKQGLDSLALKVRVQVKRDSIRDDLTALGILLDAMGTPVVEIRGEDEGLDHSESASVFKRSLGSKGFFLVDGVQERQPDVIVSLTGRVRNQSLLGATGFSGAVVSLEAGAMQQSTKKVIASRETVANGAGLSGSAALREAYQKAAEELADQLTGAIGEKWSQEITSGRPIQLIVKADQYALVQQLSKELQHVFGIKHMDLKSYKNNEAHFLIRFTGQSKTLVDLLSRLQIEKCSLCVLHFDTDKVELAVREP
jgi:hypothetical protein